MRGHLRNKIAIMSDDEYETMSNTSMKGDEAFAKRKQGVQKNELNEQLKDYINQWRDERSKEEAELKRLKDKQAARKEIRAEQDRLQAQEKKAAEEEVKKKQMEEAEIKRQEMMAAQKEGGKKSSGPAMDARKEMSKTKEQVEEEMKISLRIRIKPLDLDSMDSDELKSKAQKIYDTILQLETDRYDYEQRQLDQEYELKELAERQKLQQRNKAIKKGLDPESFTQKHPPHHQDVLQVREEDGHQKLRRPQEAVRGWRRGDQGRVAGVELEGEVRGVLEAPRQEAAKVVRSSARQKGWRSRDTRG